MSQSPTFWSHFASQFSDSACRARPTHYEVQKEDALDQQVGLYFCQHPGVYAAHNIYRKQAGTYELDGREITVEWQHSERRAGTFDGSEIKGLLVVADGPLRQPFADYIEMTDQNAEYVPEGIAQKSALQKIPKELRLSFGDADKTYPRQFAMKVAKEQALARERAATYSQEGRPVPRDLISKYNKMIENIGPVSVEEVLERCQWRAKSSSFHKGGS